MIFFVVVLFSFGVDSAREVMERAEAKMIAAPMDQKALDRLLQAQATFEAVGGLTQDRLVAQVHYFHNVCIFVYLYVIQHHTFCTHPSDTTRFSKANCSTTRGVSR